MQLDDVEKLLNTATSPDDVFGTDDPEKKYFELRVQIHPDKFLSDRHKALADKLTKRLATFWDSKHKPAATITSPERTYEVIKSLAAGEFSDVHICKSDILVKIAKGRKYNNKFQNEIDLLKKLNKRASGNSFEVYFPKILETFSVKEPGRAVRNATAFKNRPHVYTLEQVREKYKSGVHIKDMAWMVNRLFSALGFAHQVGIVHGAVLPNHVLIDTKDHSALIVGWTQAVSMPGRIKSISSKYESWYPEEVIQKRDCGPQTDIYMAARCAMYLLGIEEPSKLPPKFRGFFKACLMPQKAMRPDDAWEVHDDFGEILASLFGPRKFRKFVM